ncbi:MAG TPA: hypothetical protein VL171_08150 [Verrucomicrobiae bacterium]|nr:hypothetical protein [Verrucomicrobiae bacterium]
MKPSFVAVSIALLLTAGSSRAQTNSFQVKISGTITCDTNKFPVKTADLLSSPSNIVVLTTMATNNPAGFFMISIDEVDPAITGGGTNVVRHLFANGWDGVQVRKGKFTSLLFGYYGQVTFTNLPSENGGLMIVGKLKIKNDEVQGLSGTINGFWKHPLWDPTNEPAALFKGTIKTKAPVDIPVPVPVSWVD